jgi:hypothetical protein
VDNNYLDLGMSKSGFIHTLPGGRLNEEAGKTGLRENKPKVRKLTEGSFS